MISSTQNPLVKSLFLLKEKSSERKKRKIFLVEGAQEIELALEENYTVDQILICYSIFENKKLKLSLGQKNIDCIEISEKVYQKLATRSSTEGVLGVLHSKNHSLNTLSLPKNPLLLIAESIEKPGNIGALLRTADAAGVDAVILTNCTTDLYNPNVIRSSVGCLFTTQIAIATSIETLDFLKKNNISSHAAALTTEALPYQKQHFNKATAIIVGTESTGLSEIWLKEATKQIYIPMHGKIDSLNVSVATGILLFEAVSQRTQE